MVLITTIHSILTKEKLLHSKTFIFRNIKTLSKAKLFPWRLDMKCICSTKTYKFVFKYYLNSKVYKHKP